MEVKRNIALNKKIELQNNKAFNERFTICYVIKKGYFNLVRYLLKQGKDPNEIDLENSSMCRTALIYCTYIKDEEWALSIARNLLEFGAMLNLTDSNNLTPIHYCAAFGLDKLLDLFLDSLDFDISRIYDKFGNNALYYAVQDTKNSCSKLLLQKCYKHQINRICYKNMVACCLADLNQVCTNEIERKKSTSTKKDNESFFATELRELSENFELSENTDSGEDSFGYMETLFNQIYSNKRDNLDGNIRKSKDFSNEKRLVNKSYLKNIRSRVDNLINYNNLFAKKQYMFTVKFINIKII